jgi:MscS family membrane protein
MVDSVLDNLSLRTQRKADLRLEINLQTPSSRLQELINGVRKIMERKEIEESSAYMSEITGQAFIISGEYFTSPVTIHEFNGLRQKINLDILKLLEELQIGIAGADKNIHIIK